MKAFSIRALRLDDAHQLLQFEQDNRDWFERHIDPRGDAFYTPDGVREHIRQYLDAQARATWHPCVMLNQDGLIVGRANLKDIDLGAGIAEVGYRMARQQAGNGLATGALRYLIDLARSQWGLARLSAYVTADNAASARVLEKCGFARRERIPDLAKVNGVWLDGYQFSRELACPGPVLAPA
ncbi:ribosomal-protein-alanine N-acetyltransferase [Oxalobacteraceae bacterium GrIS 1.11]